MNDSALIRRDRPPLPPGPELREVFERFLRLSVAEDEASPETIRSYRTGVKNFLRWIGPERAARASPQDIEAYRAHLTQQGNARSTVAIRLAAVRALYRAVQRQGLRPDNPAEGVRPPPAPEAREDQVLFLPLAGLRVLLQLPDSSKPVGIRDQAILILMAVHGLRVAEVANLQMENLDLGAETASLRLRGKGKKRRRVFLIDESRRALENWIEIRGRVAGPRETALFVTLSRSGSGIAISTRALRYRVDGYLRRIGLKRAGLSCHSLRHAAATWSLYGGADLQAIAGMLGHSSVKTTEQYARLVDRVRNNPAHYLWAVLSSGQACDAPQ